jgi:hypothetical protein
MYADAAIQSKLQIDQRLNLSIALSRSKVNTTNDRMDEAKNKRSNQPN